MYTEYTIIQQLHSDIENNNLFKYHHFRQGWYSYINLLDINYTSGFCCNVCGSNPTTVVMDGTAISFRRALDSWQSFVSSSIPSANAKLGR